MMRVMTTLMVSLLAAGTAYFKTGDVADTSWRTQTPEPLTPRAFQVPEAQTATLSNGVEVSVVENHEMPLVNVRVAFDQGAWTDIAPMLSAASMTLDMLNEGAGEYDAAGILEGRQGHRRQPQQRCGRRLSERVGRCSVEESRACPRSAFNGRP